MGFLADHLQLDRHAERLEVHSNVLCRSCREQEEHKTRRQLKRSRVKSLGVATFRYFRAITAESD